MVEMNGVLYFRASDGTSGEELWRSDGTRTGTVRVADIRTGAASSRPASLVNMNGMLYFAATDANGRELWRSGGTAQSTQRVKDIVAGADSSEPSMLINVNGTLYFAADDGAMVASSGAVMEPPPGRTSLPIWNPVLLAAILETPWSSMGKLL